MPVPVVSVAEMRDWERQSWEAGRSQSEVIGRVGQLVAERALALTRPDDRILILAGKGHNGDDARCAQPHLAGRKVRILQVSDPRASLGELDVLLAKHPALIIDGLFGIGLNRPLDPPWIEFIEQVNEARLPLLAVDVPSGLNAETGEPEGTGLHASVTLTLAAPKRGLLKPSSHPFAGRLEVEPDIGLIPCPFEGEQYWTLPRDFDHFPPVRGVAGHKGSFGHVAIVGGSRGYHGAAVLAARGALRARPGLVSLFCPEDVYYPVASQLQAAMVHSWQPGQPLPESCSSLVIGPGLAAPGLEKHYRKFINEQWQTSSLPVLIDASALDWLDPGSTPLNSCRVITPHPGEAARMLGGKSGAIQENRVQALRELSSRHGNCWVVLKGHQTLIGRSSGEIFINPSGNPFLAQGGSGDVLSGFLGGLLAQPSLQPQPLKCICCGIWLHGAAADELSAQNSHWTIEELIQKLGERPGR